MAKKKSTEKTVKQIKKTPIKDLKPVYNKAKETVEEEVEVASFAEPIEEETTQEEVSIDKLIDEAKTEEITEAEEDTAEEEALGEQPKEEPKKENKKQYVQSSFGYMWNGMETDF